MTSFKPTFPVLKACAASRLASEPLLNILGTIPDQRTDFMELRPAPQQAPPPERSHTHV